MVGKHIFVLTYTEPMKATSNQKANPWTNPECSMWNLNGISILENKSHSESHEANFLQTHCSIYMNIQCTLHTRNIITPFTQYIRHNYSSQTIQSGAMLRIVFRTFPTQKNSHCTLQRLRMAYVVTKRVTIFLEVLFD